MATYSSRAEWAAAQGSGGSTVTLPTVIGSRWTDTGLLDGFAFADYAATVADLVASPGDATQYNTAKFAAFSSSSGVITVRHLATPSTWDWFTGPAYTAGCNFWPMGGRGFFEAHVRTADGANMGGTGNSQISLIVRPTGALGNPRKFLQAYFQMGVGKGCGIVQYNGGGATDNGASTPTAGQADTGYWFRFEVDHDGTARVYRIAGAAGARPALHTYIPIIILLQFFKLNVTIGADTHVDKSLEAGLIVHTSGSTSTGTNDNFIVSGLRIGRSLVTTVQ